MNQSQSLVKPEYKVNLSEVSQLLPLIFTMAIVLSIFKALLGYDTGFCLYVKSPLGKIYKFPMWQALRIIRKRNTKNKSSFIWKLAEVEPVRKKLNRWQHFKIAIGISDNK